MRYAWLLLFLAGCSGSPDDDLARGVEHTEAERWDDAVAAFTDALEAKPDWADALVNRGVAYAGKGDFAAARADFDKAIALAPADGDAYVGRGTAAHGAKDFKQAIADFTRAIELDEADLDAYRNRALTFAALQEYEAAYADYSSAIALDPDNVEWYEERAALRREEGEEDAASVDDVLAELTRLGDRRRRGLVFFEVGEYGLTIADLTEALKANAKDGDAYLVRGHAWFVQGFADKAVADYGKAIEFGRADGYAGRANAYETLGDFVAAIADYDKAVQVAPDDADAAVQFAWLLATHPAKQYRDGMRARALATKAATLTEGRDWQALDALAAACAETGDFQSAVRYAEDAHRLAVPEQKEAVEKRLELYRNRKPYRDDFE